MIPEHRSTTSVCVILSTDMSCRSMRLHSLHHLGSEQQLCSRHLQLQLLHMRVILAQLHSLCLKQLCSIHFKGLCQLQGGVMKRASGGKMVIDFPHPWLHGLIMHLLCSRQSQLQRVCSSGKNLGTVPYPQGASATVPLLYMRDTAVIPEHRGATFLLLWVGGVQEQTRIGEL